MQRLYGRGHGTRLGIYSTPGDTSTFSILALLYACNERSIEFKPWKASETDWCHHGYHPIQTTLTGFYAAVIQDHTTCRQHRLQDGGRPPTIPSPSPQDP
ncbi:hypothetical protein Pcinc_028577 [Petrolisthes cinctipes]|uniref:Uncharacterized protein n=1 Tax=Petrolisthes cinctipes TaxID=88211 RepID=A0AAE1F3C1_PETCI|nr:hypothetical protein Pcinc_028577 [Petrolisthes cinctipes]